MDMPEYYNPAAGAAKSPRSSSLQGPRPAPLKVRKDSHKIRKPPVPPPQHPPPAAAPPRPPVIIYTVSPKVIHANPNEFMTLVQRLTGPDHSTQSSTVTSTVDHSASFSGFQEFGFVGALSPAARFATIEKAKSPPGRKPAKMNENEVEDDVLEGLERSNGLFPGILSPNPSSLQPIPPNLFSPIPSDHHQNQNPLGFFHDFSPVLHNNKHYLEGSFFYSPSTFISPRIASPNTPNLDLFNNIFYL